MCYLGEPALWITPHLGGRYRFMLGRSDTSNLLNALFAAATQDSLETSWSEFLAQLGAMTRADSVSLLLDLETGETRHWQTGAMAMPDLLRLRQMRNERVYSQTDLPGGGAQDRPLRAVRCAIPAGGQTILMVQHPQRDFRGTDGLQLDHLAPYMGQAMGIWLHLRNAHARAAIDRDISRQLGAGAIIFNPSGGLIDISPAARTMIEAQSGLSLPSHGRLDCADPLRARALRQGLSAALADPGQPVSVALSATPPLHLSIRAGLWGERRALIGILRGVTTARLLPLDQIARALCLNRSEARLAALLCDGFSLRDAATELGWTIETARSASKQIFARCGISGQPELLRKMLTGVLWFQDG